MKIGYTTRCTVKMIGGEYKMPDKNPKKGKKPKKVKERPTINDSTSTQNVENKVR